MFKGFLFCSKLPFLWNQRAVDSLNIVVGPPSAHSGVSVSCSRSPQHTLLTGRHTTDGHLRGPSAQSRPSYAPIPSRALPSHTFCSWSGPLSTSHSRPYSKTSTLPSSCSQCNFHQCYFCYFFLCNTDVAFLRSDHFLKVKIKLSLWEKLWL